MYNKNIQNNIDNVLYYGGFEENLGCTFCCSECIGKQIKHIPPYCHDIFDSETSECEGEDQYNAIVENETDKIIIDDNIIEFDIDDSEWMNNICHFYDFTQSSRLTATSQTQRYVFCA